MNPTAANGADTIRTTLRSMIDGTEQLIATLEEKGADGARDAIAEMRGRVSRARAEIGDAGRMSVRRARVAARRADRYARENPWATAGGATALGLAVGAALAALIARR